jgi:phosphate transport system permease protein
MKFFKSDQHWVWFNAGAIAISIVMVVSLIIFIAIKGLSHFWPAEVKQFELYNSDGQKELILGEVYKVGDLRPENNLTQHLLKVGNRETYGLDFRWADFPADLDLPIPSNVMVLERYEWGNFYGFLHSVQQDGVVHAGAEAEAALHNVIERVDGLFDQAHRLEKGRIGAINYRIEKLRLKEKRLALDGNTDPLAIEKIDMERQALLKEYKTLEIDLNKLYQQVERDTVVAKMANGQLVNIAAKEIVSAYYPNNMSMIDKVGAYLSNIWVFLSEDPRESNTQGGVFPAIFGTVMMVLLMSVVVTPLGVVAAVYMREYAKQGAVTQVIRIAVNNLAGVPSIVYGVFGLGFFVYFLGGSIDSLFYPEAKPAPTFGTSGLLWASLTLALLTLPVVIVSTEEGLSRIPKSIREGSLALGATKLETLWRTVLPMSSPAMMTGLILAVARAAGEVAPLMLVGVVKLAPTLPVDGNAPFLHLDRKFMHLGYHIYDVGFQSPNVEAARPIVFATAFLLVAVIILLNLVAIKVRNQLREKYKALEN